MASVEDLEKLRVVDLRAKLTEIGLSTSGKKEELVNRLHAHYKEQENQDGGNAEVEDVEDKSTEAEESAEENEIEEAEEPSTDAAAQQEEASMDVSESHPPEQEESGLETVDESASQAAVTPDTIDPPSQEQIEMQEQQEQDEKIMLLLNQQQTLLAEQKTAQEARQQQSRKLIELRKQLEDALRQNSSLQQQHQGSHSTIEQLQQQRQQLLAQGEAIASMQSSLSEDLSTYQDQRMLNEQLIRQVMEQQQRKDAEQQTTLYERQQKLLAEQQAAQIAMQQSLEQRRKQAETLFQQQNALIERQREQEDAMRKLYEQQQIQLQKQREEELRRQQEEELRRKVQQEEMQRKAKQEEEQRVRAQQEAELRLKQEAEAAELRKKNQATEENMVPAGQKLEGGSEEDNNAKLPKALEDMLSYKDVRAKQMGVDDIEVALSHSRSSVTVQPLQPAPQLPLGDVNEYDDDEEDEADSKQSNQPKESKNKRRKNKKKARAAKKAEEKKKIEEKVDKLTTFDGEESAADSGIEVEYVQERPLVDIMDPLYSQFHKIFETFKIEERLNRSENGAEAGDSNDKNKASLLDASQITKRGATHFGELEDLPVTKRTDKPSKKALKKMNRMSVAQLKNVVARPDLVEMHDVTGPDPKLLLALKATRNSVPVPRHWCNKRKYLQGKRGFEKPPFDLPDYIKATGIMEMRQALADKEEQKTLKQKMREKVRPKMGKIDIDYQKLHDAFFKHQRKPKMTVHGDLYYEGKEFETRLKEKKPGNLSDDLRTALGMPIGHGAERFPPPWLIAMQRYGPPPSYPNLKIPGLNSPIPDGCSFGYHAGGWGKPPVDEMGKPLYGDVFGQNLEIHLEPVNDDSIDKGHWGEMESESEEESESESEEERDEEAIATGLITPAEAGLVTPSGTASSIPTGMETPDAIVLRKQIEDAMDAGGETPSLYQILPEKRASVGAAMMGSTHTYDLSTTKRMTGDGVEVTLNPEELDMDTVAMQAKYEQTVRAQQAESGKEDFSDMVAEHSAKAAKKRKKQQTSEKSTKKHKDFKF